MGALLRSRMDNRVFSQVLLNSGRVQQDVIGEVSCVSNLQLVLCEGDYSVGKEDDPIPPCAPPPCHTSSCVVSDWVLKKVGEIQACVEISCDGFEEQFKALLIAIESRLSLALKSASKIERELKKIRMLY